MHKDKILKEGSQSICLLVILIDSFLRTGKNYYHRVFLEECKFLQYITGSIETYSDGENSDYSDEGISNEENNLE